jgi:c-di-GMP-binding flagellar brake protein YcgR
MLDPWEHNHMAVGHKGVERRKAIRYPVEAKVAVRTKEGQTIHATAVDISSSSMRLRLGERCPLALGDEVTVEVQLPEHPNRSFSKWGIGRVAYIDGSEAGIQLYGGQFDSATPGALS